MFGFTLYRISSDIDQSKVCINQPNISGLFQILIPNKLLESHVHHIKTIDELVGVSKNHFDRFYREAIENFARFVQQLPASEIHHHAGPGGLLQHVLEVCVTALKIRRSYLLSSSGGAEAISRKQDLWTYAIFTGALCHDLAKPAVDQIITLYDEEREESTWDPWTSFMDERGIWYTSCFRRNRTYRLHEKASSLLVHRIVPPHGVAWLASDQAIFNLWLANLSGEHENAEALGEIISRADGQSVSKNLGADQSRMPGVRVKPLHEKMLTSLRFLLREGKLPLNRNGAAGWVKGANCWLVSKRTVDAIREQLSQEEHAGIPVKNGRLFDELQENGILDPCGEKAIWTAKIVGEGWENELTLIKVPVSRIWSAENRPAEFTGNILPAQVVDINAKHDGSITSELFQDDRIYSEEKKHKEIPTPVGSLDKAEADAGEHTALLAFLPTSNKTSDDVEKQNNTLEMSGSGVDQMSSSSMSESSLVEQDAKRAKLVQLIGQDVSGECKNAFIAWVKKGIKNGTIKVNQPKARVHIVEEGVLLVTPGIFQDCAKASEGQDWIKIQKAFLKRNLHRKDAQGLNMMKYQVKGKEKKAVVNAILIPEASLFFGVATLPQPNPHLVALKD